MFNFAAVLTFWFAFSTTPAGALSTSSSATRSNLPRFREGSVVTPSLADNSGYFYNAIAQKAVGTGASVTFTVAKPNVGVSSLHSLVEMAVESADEKQSIEFGWTVDRALNHDSDPHIFVFHSIDNVGLCENACGFVSTSSSVHAGSQIKPGKMATFAIQFKTNRWYLSFNGSTIGYFPSSLWKGKFTKTGKITTFGEVNSGSTTKPTAQMGNGILGTKPGAAVIKNFKLLGGTPKTPVYYRYYRTNPPPFYRMGSMMPGCKINCGMSFGGPGG